MEDNKNFNQPNIFYCYSYRLNKFLKLLGFNCIEVAKNPNSHQKYWAFERKNDNIEIALEYWNNLVKEFNIK